MLSATSVPSSGTRMGRDKSPWALSFTSLSFPMAAPRLHPATSTVQHSLYPTQRRADHPTACTSVQDSMDAATPAGPSRRHTLSTPRPGHTVRRGAEASGERHRGIAEGLSGPDREVGLNRGAVFLLACILAVVGGGAIPGPAGTILLVLGILIALAVAAAWFFRTTDSWTEGTGTGESRRRSGPTGPVELPSATVNLVGQRHKRNALARRHLAPHRIPNVQTQQAEAGPRKKT